MNPEEGSLRLFPAGRQLMQGGHLKKDVHSFRKIWKCFREKMYVFFYAYFINSALALLNLSVFRWSKFSTDSLYSRKF